jgi:hypothetical protein
MFALNPQTKQFREGRVDAFWRTLYEKLDHLSKLHLIVCPDSRVHEEESLIHPQFEAMRRTYEQLSHGVTFQDSDVIERFQVVLQALQWLEGGGDKSPELARDRVVQGNLNAWLDPLSVSIRSRVTAEMIEALRAYRDETYEGTQQLFEKWRQEKETQFATWFEREIEAYGQSVLRVYGERVRWLAEVHDGVREPSIEDIQHPPAVVLVTMIQSDFEQKGLAPEEALRRTCEYLRSPTLRNVPTLRIHAMLWAAIARKAAAGQRRPPSRGTVNDVKVISTVLPYCDAVFLDNEMRGYLQEEPLRSNLRYGKRVFSQNSREEFLKYLDDLRQQAPGSHIALVNEVYGREWTKPFMEILDRGGDAERSENSGM